MIAVDASALSAFILKEPKWKELSKYLVDSISVDHVLKEVANAIWRACAVKGFIEAGQAYGLNELLKSMKGINIILESEDKYLDRALRIALELRITVYDALYIALAKEKNIPLLTLDEKQAQAASKLDITVLSV